MEQSMLKQLVTREKPIRVAIAGCGEFGLQMVTQIARIPNMEVAVIGDVQPQVAAHAFMAIGWRTDQIVITDTVAGGISGLEKGSAVVLTDAVRLAELPVDVVCDVTGDPIFGAEIAYRTIMEGKHMVVVNIESDVGIGALLAREAARTGVVYTAADGDQPSLIKGLCDWSRCLGLEVLVAGKWTSMYPPVDYDKATRRTDLGYLDGSKNQEEMCCVANMTGLVPDRRGMHHPLALLAEIPNTFATIEDGGILGRYGIVDVVNCRLPSGILQDAHLGGGVFVEVTSNNPECLKVIRNKGVLASRDGRRALLYRPFHLVGIEAPMSILRAVLYGEATGAPLQTPVADVVAIAKRDLAAGERLDGIGGFTVRGEIESAPLAHVEGLLPLCLAEDVHVRHAVLAGTPITHAMLEREGTDFMWRLRRLQDRLIHS